MLDLSVRPGPQLIQLHEIVRREGRVRHSQSLRQVRLAQERRPHRLRGEDLEGVPEDDVSDVGGHDYETEREWQLSRVSQSF